MLCAGQASRRRKHAIEYRYSASPAWKGQKGVLPMQKKPIIWFAILLSLLLPLVAACGAPPSSSQAPGISVSPGELLHVLDGYNAREASTEQHIVAFHPGTNTSAVTTLPAGLTSQDHQRLYVATSQGNQTSIVIYNTQTGATLGAFTIPGAYSTGIHGYDTGVLSPNGRWLALRQLDPSGSLTTIALVDTQARKIVKTETLGGDFDLDAISPNAQTLYLLQNMHDAEQHYYVRAYDLTTSQLNPAIIVDKNEIDETDMQGQAQTRQMAPDGAVSYTLYTNQQENKAFIHILPLQDVPDALLARCIDLPVGASPTLLAYYTLALTPDGRTLYAINTALGTMTRVTVQADEVFNIPNGTTQHFTDTPSSATSAPLPYNGAVISLDQQTLYVAGVDGIWALATSDGRVLGHYLAGQAFTSVALSADGQMLYVVSPSQGIVLFNLATGQNEQTMRGPAQSPWAIVWVSK
jgi:DNA-binding beta-propeller fold protein YncE